MQGGLQIRSSKLSDLQIRKSEKGSSKDIAAIYFSHQNPYQSKSKKAFPN
jgi:hypothetical protein